MNRIDTRFAELKAAGRKGLVAYLTAGDPDLKASEENVRIALQGGVDVLELGVPFSDPTADGPTIQAAAYRALEAGTNLNDVLAMVKSLRKDFDTPIVLFGYANPFFRYGYERICRDAVDAGVDGFLVVDMPYEICGELKQHTDATDLRLIPLVAPTTAPERAGKILAAVQGFAYYIMVKGVTGARQELVMDLGERIADLRGVTGLPIAAGFGVSNGEQAAEVARTADAVVVGSALVRAAHEGGLTELVADLRRGIDGISDS
jgi:tryptophan synthase alpha chain